MKAKTFSSIVQYFLIPCFLTIFGCSTTPVLEMPERLPPIVKVYKHFTIHGYQGGDKNTEIYLNKGDIYSVLATGEIGFSSWSSREPIFGLIARIGENPYFAPVKRGSGLTSISNHSGDLYLAISHGWRGSSGSFSVDVIVWQREDYVQIAEFFEMMKAKDPNNKTIEAAFFQANRRKEHVLATQKVAKEIEETKEEIAALKEGGKTEKEILMPSARPPKTRLEKPERVMQLEAKLAKLEGTLAQLREIEKKWEDERQKRILLTKELEEKQKREKELLTRLEDSSKTPPLIAIASPMEGSEVEAKTIIFSGVAEDDQGLQSLEAFINDEPFQKKIGRGIRFPEKNYPKRIDFRERIPLRKGENRIRIRAIDSDGLSSEKVVTVLYIEKRRNVWAVVIGIDHYANIRQLKYAVNDAEMFYDHLVKYNLIPAENVILLIDKQATLRNLKSTLGTDLKNKAGKEDMVIIFFAGHGATEKDVMSPDGDGLEKYLLAYDADPRDLYATALPMREISQVFRRIRSERLVFIADSCYSGASGGRTIDITGMRASISDAFLDRIATGKGRVIITASGANEVSAENDELKHGVFTYYLVEGLKGKADTDKDGLITVDEVYRYVSDKVPQTTGQEQHPVKKGTVEGRIILGVIQ
jgi:hypothetical protein